MQLLDHVVIVTGGGQGIGRAVAAMYAAHGAHVVIAERDPQTGEAAANAIQKAHAGTGGSASFYPVDVSQPKQIEDLMSMADERWGRLDVLVNNAGISAWESPYDLSVEAWDRILNTNLRSVFLASREAARIMRRNDGGAIINLSSTRAHQSEPNTEAYAASKGGILALTHALAVSLSPDRITVNAISPGWIETGDYAELRDEDHAQHPAGRVGRPDDIARACLFLTQKENDFITGAELIIDGGMTRKMIYVP
ncbi:SDR family NAD(P)-dependent oxidoreductase [Brevibacillus panacihumi]|uniref:Glucose 1-dehydrogenase n=1 Tax=Brevibacillus panacihumi TaxID=497735 RepID=A0A3M8D5Y0_9BACL|nr:glucose 1-dehydrogenase [Brevibacillus panacihumi]RNB83474.1 glucose 1-dehydrogenase [Brevibacillus panacihumi]